MPIKMMPFIALSASEGAAETMSRDISREPLFFVGLGFLPEFRRSGRDGFCS
jgi:hypothetical protein